MEPQVYLQHGGYWCGPVRDHIDSYPSINGGRVVAHIGLRVSLNSTHIVYDLYEVQEFFCVSDWSRPPPSCLWGNVRDGLYDIIVIASYSRLDFTNTAFEHGYLYFMHGSRELRRLAKHERAMWGKNHREYIPFKNPHPEGYQGVYGGREMFTGSAYYMLTSPRSADSLVLVTTRHQVAQAFI